MNTEYDKSTISMKLGKKTYIVSVMPSETATRTIQELVYDVISEKIIDDIDNNLLKLNEDD